jgi:hypothetical protein
METREILLKAYKVNVAFERLDGGKIRVGTSSWDDPKVILLNQVLEVASVGKQVALWSGSTSRSLTWTSTRTRPRPYRPSATHRAFPWGLERHGKNSAGRW